MAVGQVFKGFVSLEPGEEVSIRPSSGVEAIVHNIYTSGMASLYLTNGTDNILIDSITSDYGAWVDFKFHITNDYYLKVKSLEVSRTINIAWDGVITYEE